MEEQLKKVFSDEEAIVKRMKMPLLEVLINSGPEDEETIEERVQSAKQVIKSFFEAEVRTLNDALLLTPLQIQNLVPGKPSRQNKIIKKFDE